MRPIASRWAPPTRRWGRAALIVAALVASLPAHAEPKDDARRHYMAGIEAANQQNFEVALREFLLAQSLYPNPSNLFSIGLSYASMGRQADAVSYFEQALDGGLRLPPQSLLYVAAAYAATGRTDDAVALYQAVKEQDSSLAPQVDPIIAALQEPAAEASSSAGASQATAATSAEVERLQAIAAELAALTEQLASRKGAPEPEATADPAAPQEPVAEAPSAVLDQDAFSTDAYERVVVTASRYGQDPLDSPSTVTILTADDIRMSGATNIPDVLRQVVGVDVMSLSAADPSVSIRGFNRELSNKVLVLIDGRTVYFDMLAAPTWSTLPIGLVDIERIEIIRGPGSAVYGANAMTGVINIITKTPGTGDNLVSVEGGNPGYGQGSLYVSGRSEQTAYRFSAGYHQTGRWATQSVVGDNSPLELNLTSNNLAQQTIRADGRLDRTFGDQGFASLSAGHNEGATEFYVFGNLGNFGMDFKNSYVRGDVAWGPVHLRGFWSRLACEPGPWSQYKGGRSLFTTSQSDVFDLELETNGEFETGSVEHRYAVGAGYRYKLVEWGYLEGGGEPIDEHHFNAFGQEQASIGPVDVVASLRVDRHPLVDLSKTISPRGAVVARVADRTAVRATGGTSFRAPSFMESYLDLNQPIEVDGVYIRTLGDRELVPERTVTGELGVHDESSRFHRADLVGYVNRVSNLIYVQDIEPVPPVYSAEDNGFAAGATQFGNLTPLYTGLGVELDTRFFPTDGLDLSANINVQRIYEDDGAEVVPDGSTSLVKANLGVSYRTPWRVDVSAQNHFVSAQTWRLRDFDDNGQLVVQEEEVPARNIVVGRIAARPLPDEALELAVTAWNLGHILTGETFREHPKGQPVTSRLFGTATYRF